MAKKSSFGKFIKLIGLFLAALIGAILANTLSNQSVQIQAKPVPALSFDRNVLAQALSRAIQIETVSHRDATKTQHENFKQFRKYLEQTFPLAHRTLNVEIIHDHALLYSWAGANQNIRPALFLAHYDVVAADNEHGAEWTHAPFSGAISDGYVWGRGAMDDKSAIITQLAAIETLLKQGRQPKRSLYFAYGHDEEVGGANGAAKINETLQQRGIKPEVIFDEGMPITNGVLKGINQPAALIGIAEKGYLTLELTVQGEGGHSSSPPPHSAVGILAEAITKIENNPMPARLTGPVGMMFDALGPEMAFVQKAVLSNRWLFAPILETQLAAKNSTNALIRTTAAATMFSGSAQANVLPTAATASVNFRIVPGDTIEAVVAHIKSVVNDPRVEIKISGDASEPSAISSTTSPGFNAAAKTVREIFPDTLAAPALLIASTDTRHYIARADNAYRFRPIWVAQEDIKRFHGIDERISVENLYMMAQYYGRLFQNLDD